MFEVQPVFVQLSAFSKWCMQNVGHFVTTSMCVCTVLSIPLCSRDIFMTILARYCSSKILLKLTTFAPVDIDIVYGARVRYIQNTMHNHDTKRISLPYFLYCWEHILTHCGRVKYIRRCVMSTLFLIMTCRLGGAKPLSDPMLSHWHLDPWKQTSAKFGSDCTSFN